MYLSTLRRLTIREDVSGQSISKSLVYRSFAISMDACFRKGKNLVKVALENIKQGLNKPRWLSLRFFFMMEVRKEEGVCLI